MSAIDYTALADYEQANFTHNFFQQLMPTFQEFKEAKPAKDEQVANVLRYSEILCEALTQNFTSSHPNSDPYKFYIESGRKYHKIIMEIPNENRDPSRSVHAFVDKKTGEVYKPASFKAPAKIVRYDLRIIEQREWLLENADWAGGYLYVR